MQEGLRSYQEQDKTAAGVGNPQTKRSDSRTDPDSVANMDFSDYIFFLEEMEHR